MREQDRRTALLLSEEGVKNLKKCHVAVFGIGGVGGFTAEALARAGIGAIDLIDFDTVNESNINRQIIADHRTVGRKKVEVMKERIYAIDPDIVVRVFDAFFLPENSGEFPFGDYDYVVDAIDTVSGKIGLAVACKEANTPLISAMGTGNKLDPTQFEVTDITKTSVCPLARVMRRELKARGIDHLKVVYSKETPIVCSEETPILHSEETPIIHSGKTIGSVSFVPSVAGLILAGEVIKELARG